MQYFHFSPSAESRLIYLAKGPEASPEGGEKKEAKPISKEPVKTVKDVSEKTAKEVRNLIPETAPVEPAPAPREPKQIWKPVPRPHMPLKNAAIAGAAIAAPMVVLPAAGAVWGWKKIAKYPPFRWVDNGLRRGASIGLEGVRGVAETAKYPFRLAGSLSMNALRLGGAGLNKLVVEPYKAIRTGLNHKLNIPGETSLLGTAAGGLKEIFSSPFRLVGGLGHFAKKHPWWTSIAAFTAYNYVTAPVQTVAFFSNVASSFKVLIDALSTLLKIKGTTGI